MIFTNIETENPYMGRMDNLGVTNGAVGVSISITPGREYGEAVTTSLTPEQARELSAALITHAEDVESRNAPKIRHCGCAY